MTTYTTQFLGLPNGVWTQEGGDRHAGEGIVIGFIDTGINPVHPSFAYDPTNPFTSNPSHFSGACEAGPHFPASSCNGKIVSARYFSAGAQTATTLNTSVDFLSPFDAVGHGRYTHDYAFGLCLSFCVYTIEQCDLTRMIDKKEHMLCSAMWHQRPLGILEFQWS